MTSHTATCTTTHHPGTCTHNGLHPVHAAAAHPDDVTGFLHEAIHRHVALVQVFQIRPPRPLPEVQTVPETKHTYMLYMHKYAPV